MFGLHFLLSFWYLDFSLIFRLHVFYLLFDAWSLCSWSCLWCLVLSLMFVHVFCSIFSFTFGLHVLLSYLWSLILMSFVFSLMFGLHILIYLLFHVFLFRRLILTLIFSLHVWFSLWCLTTNYFNYLAFQHFYVIIQLTCVTVMFKIQSNYTFSILLLILSLCFSLRSLKGNS